MKWTPELPVRPDVSRRELQEWLNRQFRRISTWSTNVQNKASGYGGIRLINPITVNLALTQTPVKFQAFDAGVAPNPINVVQDFNNDEITPLATGMWCVAYHITGTVTPSSANASRTIVLQLRDETTGLFLPGHAYSPISRYGETFTFAGAVTGDIDETEINHQYAVYVNSRTTTGIVIEDVEISHFSIFRVDEAAAQPAIGTGGGDGVPEAPEDGTYYGRRNAAWAAVTEEAPNDATLYGRQSLGWAAVPAIIPEAPSDGTPYARQDAGWVQTTLAGYGGIRRDANLAVTLNLTTTPAKFNNFELNSLTNPVDVTQNAAGGSITIPAGSWDIAVHFSGVITASSSTTPRTVVMRVYSDAGVTALPDLYVPVAQYSTGFGSHYSFMRRFTTSETLELYLFVTSGTLTFTSIIYAEFSARRLGPA